MATMNIIGRIPMDYNDFGAAALSDKGREKLDELICSQLHNDVFCCGDELIAPVDWDGELDVNEIITAARDQMVELYNGEEYWEI